jgi:hypothetical protein
VIGNQRGGIVEQNANYTKKSWCGHLNLFLFLDAVAFPAATHRGYNFIGASTEKAALSVILTS